MFLLTNFGNMLNWLSEKDSIKKQKKNEKYVI